MLLKYFKIEKRHSGLPIKSKLLKYCVAHVYCTDPHFSLHNDLMDFLISTHKEVALQLNININVALQNINVEHFSYTISCDHII